MGRRDFRALGVHKTATQLLEAKRLQQPPPWYDIIATFPPSSQTAVRPVLQQKPFTKGKRPSKMFKPVQIRYEEDVLRKEFFSDHPWELARPRIVLEDDGKDGEHRNWAHIQQPGKVLDGESVIQRQMYLMNHENLSKAAAYDQARREFYVHRHKEDVERRIAREEALSTGAYFGPSAIDIGLKLEDEAFENWKAWAKKEAASQRQRDEASYTSYNEDEGDEGTESGEALDTGEVKQDSAAVP